MDNENVVNKKSKILLISRENETMKFTDLSMVLENIIEWSNLDPERQTLHVLSHRKFLAPNRQIWVHNLQEPEK